MSENGEITVREMDRKSAIELLNRIKSDALERASTAEREADAERQKRRDEAEAKTDERREFLRRQAAELQAEEEK